MTDPVTLPALLAKPAAASLIGVQVCTPVAGGGAGAGSCTRVAVHVAGFVNSNPSVNNTQLFNYLALGGTTATTRQVQPLTTSSVSLAGEAVTAHISFGAANIVGSPTFRFGIMPCYAVGFGTAATIIDVFSGQFVS